MLHYQFRVLSHWAVWIPIEQTAQRTVDRYQYFERDRIEQPPWIEAKIKHGYWELPPSWRIYRTGWYRSGDWCIFPVILKRDRVWDSKIFINAHIRINHSNISIHHKKPLIGTRSKQLCSQKRWMRLPEIVPHKLHNGTMATEELLKLSWLLFKVSDLVELTSLCFLHSS